ncbi:tetratricopeptide repeat protein [Geodermatophilus sp. URMC 64]
MSVVISNWLMPGVVSTRPQADVTRVASLLAEGWRAAVSGDNEHAVRLFAAAAKAADGFSDALAGQVVLASAAGGRAWCTGRSTDWDDADKRLGECPIESLDAQSVAVLALRRDDPSSMLAILAGRRAVLDPWAAAAVAMLRIAGKDHRTAVDLLAEAASRRPSDAHLQASCARLLEQADADGTALRERAGHAFLALGQADLAVDQLEQVITTHPERAGARLVLAEALRLSGRLAAAAEEADRVARAPMDATQTGTSVAALRVETLAYAQLGDARRARRLLHQLVDANPGAVGTSPGVIDDLLEAAVRESEGDLEGAVDYLSPVGARAPNDIQVADELSRLLLRLHRASEVKEVLDRAIAAGVRHPVLFARRAAVGDKRAARADLLRAQALDRTPTSAWLRYADELRLAGRVDNAIDVLRLVHEATEDDSDVLASLADLLRDAGRPEEVVELLGPAVQSRDADPELLSRLAESLLRLNRHEDSLSVTERALELRPGEPSLLVVRGLDLAALGRFPEAVQALEPAVDAGYRHPLVVASLAEAYERTDRSGEADALLASVAIEEDVVLPLVSELVDRRLDRLATGLATRALVSPRAQKRLRGSLLLELGRLHLYAGDADDAVTALTQARDALGPNAEVDLLLATALGPENRERALALLEQSADELGSPELSVRRADVLVDLGESGRARQQLDAALSAWPRHPRLLFRRAQLLLDLGDADGAERSLSAIGPEAAPGLPVDELRAEVLQKRGDFRGAAQLWTEIRESNPTDPRLRERLTWATLAAGDAQGALELVEQARGAGEDSASMLEAEGYALAMLGRLNPARQVLERVVGTDESAMQARAMLTEVYWQLGMSQEALRHLAVLGRQSERSVVLEYIRLARLLGRRSEALAKANAYVTDYPGDAEGWSQLGWTQLESKDTDGAIASLTRAVDLEPGNVELLHGLGRAQLECGNAYEAVAVLERATSRSGSSDTPAPSGGPDAELLMDLAEAYDLLDEPDQALERLQKLWQERSDQPGLLLDVGQRLVQLDAPDEAWTIARLLLSDSPTPEGLTLAGVLLNDAGFFTTSHRALNQAVIRSPADPRPLQPLIWALRHEPNAGPAYAETVERVLREQGPSSWLYRRLGEARLALDDPHGAVEAFGQGLSLAGASLLDEGVCQFQLGNFEAAVDRLLRLTVPRRSGSEGFDLALALLALNREEFALAEYERAIMRNERSWRPHGRRGYLAVASWELDAAERRWSLPEKGVALARRRLDAALTAEESSQVWPAVSWVESALDATEKESPPVSS